MPRLPFFAKRLTVYSLSLALVAGIMGSDRTQAQSLRSQQSVPSSERKISSELRRLAKRADQSNAAPISVIVQYKSQTAQTLSQANTDGRNSLNNRLTIKKSLKNLATDVIELTPDAIEELAANPDVAFVSEDREMQAAGHVTETTGADAIRNTGGTTTDGTGIGVAVLDSGIYTPHVSFKNSAGRVRVVVNRDFTGENRTDDPHGHGTHVASTVAGADRFSGGAYNGVAPNANIINLRVLNSKGTGSVSGVLAAVDWVLTNRQTHNIRVVNMSLGMTARESFRDDPVCRAVRSLMRVGVFVAVAAGNEGKLADGTKIYGAIHSPGIEPSVMTVGATNTFQTSNRDDDAVTTFSSRGPTRGSRLDSKGVRKYDNLLKPDLVAPGNKLVYAQSPNNLLVTQHPELDANVSPFATREMMTMSGTSMATPVVAGRRRAHAASQPATHTEFSQSYFAIQRAKTIHQQRA
jgi:subtilisin family serine protease